MTAVNPNAPAQGAPNGGLPVAFPVKKEVEETTSTVAQVTFKDRFIHAVAVTYTYLTDVIDRHIGGATFKMALLVAFIFACLFLHSAILPIVGITLLLCLGKYAQITDPLRFAKNT